MAKAKGTKVGAGGKARTPAAKPKAPPKALAAGKGARSAGVVRVSAAGGAAPKSAAIKPSAAKPGAKAAAPRPVAKPTAKPATPVSTPPAPVATAPATPGGDPSGLRTKKKVKRGAPPMLPRRLARRPPQPALGTEGAAPLAPPKATAPGSLHAPARQPEGAEGLKARLMTVMGHLARLRSLKRSLHKQFWDAGLILAQLSESTLYQAKGYGSWESFLEREVERELAIGRMLAVDLVRIVRVFTRESAEEFGIDKLREALKKLYPEPGQNTQTTTPPTGTTGPASTPWDPGTGGA